MKKFKKIIAVLFLMASASVFAQKFMLKIPGNYGKVSFKNFSSQEKISGTISFMQKTKTGFSMPEIIGGFEVDGTNSEAAFEGKISLKEDSYLIVTTSKELDGKLKVSLSRENNRIKKSILYVNFQDR